MANLEHRQQLYKNKISFCPIEGGFDLHLILIAVVFHRGLHVTKSMLLLHVTKSMLFDVDGYLLLASTAEDKCELGFDAFVHGQQY